MPGIRSVQAMQAAQVQEVRSQDSYAGLLRVHGRKGEGMTSKGFHKCRRCATLTPVAEIVGRRCRKCVEAVQGPTLSGVCICCHKKFTRKSGRQFRCDECLESKEMLDGYRFAKPHRCECGDKITTKTCVKCSTLAWMKARKISG
jgi:hypothetical protein